MKIDYNTKEYQSAVPATALNEFYNIMNDLYQIPQSKITEANTAFQEKWEDTVVFQDEEYTS